MSHRISRDALAVAIEALSWIELEGMSERQAFAKTVKQLGVRDLNSMKTAFLFIVETIRALNLIDAVASSVLSKEFLDDLGLGERNFLRVFIWWSLLHKPAQEDLISLLEAARHVLGWRRLTSLELAFGKILAWNLPRFMRKLPDPQRVAFATFNRAWFVSYCYKTFGRRFALEYLKATCKAPPTYVRINTLCGTEQMLLREIEGEGVKLDSVKSLEGLFRVVHSRRPLTQARAYRLGFFYIQDKSSYLSTVVADPAKGETVLDLCAAPGGKTSHVALKTRNSSITYSVDYSRRRMEVWKKEMRRCKVSCAFPVVADARRGLPLKQLFDLVIVDPPCTSSGAYGKVPSSKWRLTVNALERLCQTQWEIIRTAVQTVRPGGRLVYSTCSVIVEENELQIERLLKLNPEFRLERQAPFIGHEGMRGLGKCQRLYPQLDECNGYFIACLRKEY